MTGASIDRPIKSQRRVLRDRRRWQDPLDLTITAAMLVVGAVVVIPVARWGLIDAVWTGTASECQAAGNGACWSFVRHKLRFILFGLYPPDQHWRPTVAVALIVSVLGISAHPSFWKRQLIIAWATALAVAIGIMRGGTAGLTLVPPNLWGGLPVTLLLTAAGLMCAFPLAIALALGRRSRLALPRIAATAVVEVVRGIPLIAVLYVAVLVLPLTMPAGIELDKLLLAQLGIAVFAAAYLAEAIRSGLQALPEGQREAALALGMGRWQSARLVILPQAFRIVLPSFVTIAIGVFQNTSLVVIVGVFDLLNTARIAARDPIWLGFYTEAYVFAGVLFFGVSMAISRYGGWLERRVNRNPAPER